MKKNLLLLLLCTTAYAAPQEYPFEYPLAKNYNEEMFHPISIEATALRVGAADFRTRDLEGDLKYAQAGVTGLYTYPWTECWGFLFGGGFVATEVEWHQNPDFHKTHFSYVNASLGGYTKAMPNWLWTLTVTAQMDTAVFDLSEYTLYQGVLYGSYDVSDCISVTVGFILEAGLSKEKAWPIIGFAYSPCDKWELSLVYPLDMSYNYYIWPEFSIGASLRFLRDRHRLDTSEPIPMGIYEYHDWGGELDLTYTPSDHFTILAFAGSTFKGDLKVTNRDNKDATHYKFKGSFFAGASAYLTF